jgi:hypothetical protein
MPLLSNIIIFIYFLKIWLVEAINTRFANERVNNGIRTYYSIAGNYLKFAERKKEKN